MQSQDEKQQHDSAASSKSADVLETLAEALVHTDSSVRESAAREFAKRKDKRGIAILSEVLSDEDAGVRLAVANALSELGWRPTTEAQQGQHLVALQRFSEASALGQASVDPLLVLLKSADVGLRMAALETLARIGGERILKPLIDVLKDENPHVRAVAAQALSGLGNDQAVEPLIKLARDPSWEVRSVVLDALGNLNHPRRVDGLMLFLRDEVPDLRLRAAEELGNAGEAKVITALITALMDEDGMVATAVETSLKKLDANWEKTEYARGATSSLLPALKHKDESIRTKAADTLRAIGQIRAMNSYLAAEMGIRSNNTVPVLSKALKAPNRDLRQGAAEALGKLGDAAAIEPLVEALYDEDQGVREAALYALNLLNWKPANDTELVLKAVILHRWETAVLFDAVAFEPIAMALSSDDPEVCRSAISALAQLGDRRATEPLSQMLTHPVKSVRVAAAQALKLLGWLPRDARESVLQAIELEDWSTVAEHGASSVEPLVAAIKESYQNRELCEAAANALANINDAQAAKGLLSYSRDGQLAEAVVRALTTLVSRSPGDLGTDDLTAISNLNNIFQFRYTFDARYGTFVRSGLQEVDSAQLKKLARQELARRGVGI